MTEKPARTAPPPTIDSIRDQMDLDPARRAWAVAVGHLTTPPGHLPLPRHTCERIVEDLDAAPDFPAGPMRDTPGVAVAHPGAHGITVVATAGRCAHLEGRVLVTHHATGAVALTRGGVVECHPDGTRGPSRPGHVTQHDCEAVLEDTLILMRVAATRLGLTTAPAAVALHVMWDAAHATLASVDTPDVLDPQAIWDALWDGLRQTANAFGAAAPLRPTNSRKAFHEQSADVRFVVDVGAGPPGLSVV